MKEVPIYTIGYGSRRMDQFIDLLRAYGIEFVVDVRSQPYSRFNQQFSKDALEKHLKSRNIRYIFMGDTLGGRPKDATCYVDGRVDYSKVHNKPFYLGGAVCQLVCKISAPGWLVDGAGMVSLLKCKLRMTA